MSKVTDRQNKIIQCFAIMRVIGSSLLEVSSILPDEVDKKDFKAAVIELKKIREVLESLLLDEVE